MRISDWSSDVCSSDLPKTTATRTTRRCWSRRTACCGRAPVPGWKWSGYWAAVRAAAAEEPPERPADVDRPRSWSVGICAADHHGDRQQEDLDVQQRSEEHTSELQSLMRISYAVFCLKKKRNTRAR